MSGIALVTVPIGNSKDITLRALETLKAANIIFAEDTRVFKSLAREIGLDVSDKKINSFHDHSSDHELDNILKLAQSETVAFVSDAGSPIISDPAFPLVTNALKNDVPIKSVSGISAVNCALELSGLPVTPFHFHGFIGRETSKKNELFETIKSQYGTHIFFEGVSRVEKTLKELSQKFSDFNIIVARELTKEFESVYRFKGSEFSQVDITYKGEFVILIYNSSKNVSSDPKVLEIANEVLNKGSKPKLVSKLIGTITGKSSKEVYEILK